MFAKIQITGKIELVTGMHIGGASAFAAIGAVDSPIVKDVRTKLPMIPGSSFKGKMRSLLAKEYNDTLAKKPDDDAKCLTRLFGSAEKGNVHRSRVLISDMIMENAEELKKQGLQTLTEVKFENTINRLTAVAMPRQIERAIRGSVFNLDIVYEASDETETLEDIEVLSNGLKLLQYDYIGGNGSRGYGKIKINDLIAETVVGDLDDEILEKCNSILQNAII